MQFSYYEGGIKKTKPTKEISLLELVELVQDNSNIKTINYLRSLKEYDKKKYDTQKRELSLSYVTPASVLRKRLLKTEGNFSKNFVRFSGYVYFDMDHLPEPDEIKTSLVSLFPHSFSFISHSTGGKGLSILIRIDHEVKSKEEYNRVYFKLKDMFFKEYEMDDSVKDIGRAMLIGFDPNPFYNLDNIVHIEDLPLLPSISKGKRSQSINNLKTPQPYSLDKTFFSPIPINEVFEKLVFETPVNISKPIVEVFPVKYVCASVYFGLKDGVKRKTFINLIHRLCFLNPQEHPSYIFNYLVFINEKHGNPKMEYRKLKELFSYVYQSIKCDSQYVFSVPRLKYIHFRKNIPLTRNEKKNISNKLNGILQKNSSVKKILDSKEILNQQGIKITQKEIQTISGLSIPTVKRYYRVKELEDFQWWIDYFNSDEYMESMGYQPISTFDHDVNSFENQIYFHPSCPLYVIDYFMKRKSA